MRNLPFLTLLLLCVNWANAQEYPIVKDTLKQPGIYKSFAEFRDNSPSLTLDFNIVQQRKEFNTGPFNDGVSLQSFRIDMPKEQSRDLGSIFGFSDGKRFFVINSDRISLTSPNYAHNPNFNKIEYVGRYCVYDAVEFAQVQGMNMPTEVVKFIDLESGEITVLTVAKMKKLLADKPEILEKFKNQSEKQYHLKKYMIQYLKG